MRYPPENRVLPATANLRGPSRGSIAPAHVADMPSEKIAMLNAHAVSVNDQPSCLTKSV